MCHFRSKKKPWLFYHIVACGAITRDETKDQKLSPSSNYPSNECEIGLAPDFFPFLKCEIG